jgi:hypothetical protein
VTTDRTNRPTLVLTHFWAKTSAKGNTYTTGRFGAARVLVMENRDRRGDNDATHVLLLEGRRAGELPVMSVPIAQAARLLLPDAPDCDGSPRVAFAVPLHDGTPRPTVILFPGIGAAPAVKRAMEIEQ